MRSRARPRGATVSSRLLIIPRELYVVKAFFCLFHCSLLSEAALRFIIGREDSGAERERLLRPFPKFIRKRLYPIMNKAEKIAAILDLAEIPYVWLRRDDAFSLALDDDSATVSLKGDTLRVFVNCGKSFQSMDSTDLGDALRIIMTARYMQRIDGKLEDTSEAKEWIE